jgi:hypothetical protein
MDWKLELAVVPVSDVQLTPPGSACSITSWPGTASR